MSSKVDKELKEAGFGCILAIIFIIILIGLGICTNVNYNNKKGYGEKAFEIVEELESDNPFTFSLLECEKYYSGSAFFIVASAKVWVDVPKEEISEKKDDDKIGYKYKSKYETIYVYNSLKKIDRNKEETYDLIQKALVTNSEIKAFRVDQKLKEKNIKVKPDSCKIEEKDDYTTYSGITDNNKIITINYKPNKENDKDIKIDENEEDINIVIE